MQPMNAPPPRVMVGRRHLVRHGMPGVRSTDWQLDPDHLDDVRTLRDSLPPDAIWFSSPELKARQTAPLLTDEPVVIVEGLREQIRSGWLDDLRSIADRAFANPFGPAPRRLGDARRCTSRVTTTVADIRASHPDDDLVLVGRGTAWTLLVAETTGTGLGRASRDGFPRRPLEHQRDLVPGGLGGSRPEPGVSPTTYRPRAPKVRQGLHVCSRSLIAKARRVGPTLGHAETTQADGPTVQSRPP